MPPITNQGFAGTVGELQFSQTMDMLGSPTVLGPASWRPTAVPSNRQVAIGAGVGQKAGIITTSTDSYIVDLPSPPSTAGLWYLIVCRRTWGDTRTAEFLALAGDGIAASSAVTPPREYPSSFKNSPGDEDDQAIAWAFVNSTNTTVQVFDLRNTPEHRYESRTERVTGWGGGETVAIGGITADHGLEYVVQCPSRRWVEISAAAHLFVPNANVAGEFLLQIDGRVYPSKAFHTHGARGATWFPVTFPTFGLYLNEGPHTVQMRVNNNGLSDAPFEVWDGAMTAILEVP